MSADPLASRRCAVHPSRPATDECPVCDRPRCGADAAEFGGRGCPVCYEPDVGVAPGRFELVVRAALAAVAVGFAGGWVAAEYVDTQWFAVVAPGLVGLACAGVATAAAAGARLWVPVAFGAVGGVLATGLSDRLVPGGQNLFLPPGNRLPPYLAAVVGACVWPVLFGPVRRSEEQTVSRPDAEGV